MADKSASKLCHVIEIDTGTETLQRSLLLYSMLAGRSSVLLHALLYNLGSVFSK